MESSTHQLIDVQTVRDNVVVLKNKNLRAVLAVSSINFGLKSQDEQQAIVERFQDLTNSLDYSLQILIQSRTLDISEYMAFLNERAEVQTNELLKIQTAEYISFINELIKLSNVMSKMFFVVVPLNKALAAVEGSSWFGKIPFLKKQEPDGKISAADLNFEASKNELTQRVDQVTSLLSAMGLRAIPLEREELIELLYTSYNPGAVLKQKNMELLIATGEEAKKAE
ncbi:MAG: hypothetical protein HY454_00155 [Parcubacteria group bacterium]|nr:hypothetical protein [Parcubacteria group bacterium]